MTLNLTFQGHSRSSLIVRLDSPYMVSYWCSKIWPKCLLLPDTRLQNQSDLEFDLSRSLKVKFNGAVGVSIYDFLLVSNSNYMSTSHRLTLIGTSTFFFYLLSLDPNFGPTTPTLIHCAFLSSYQFCSGSSNKGFSFFRYLHFLAGFDV